MNTTLHTFLLGIYFLSTSLLFAQKTKWTHFSAEEKGVQIQVSLPEDYTQEENMPIPYPDSSLRKTVQLTGMQKGVIYIFQYSVYNRSFKEADRKNIINTAYTAFSKKLMADSTLKEENFEYSLMFPGKEALYLQKNGKRYDYRTFSYGDILIQQIVISPKSKREEENIRFFWDSVLVESK